MFRAKYATKHLISDLVLQFILQVRISFYLDVQLFHFISLLSVCIVCVTISFLRSDHGVSEKKTSKEIVLMMLFFGAFLLIFIFLSFAGWLLLSLLSSSTSSLSGLFLVSRVSENSYCINSLLFSRRCILSSSHRSFVRSHSLWLSSSHSHSLARTACPEEPIEMDASQRRRKSEEMQKSASTI